MKFVRGGSSGYSFLKYAEVDVRQLQDFAEGSCTQGELAEVSLTTKNTKIQTIYSLYSRRISTSHSPIQTRVFQTFRDREDC